MYLTERMSVSQPAEKYQKMMVGEGQVLRSPNPSLEESDHPTPATLEPMTKQLEKKPKHPRGHNVRYLDKVWGALDPLKNAFPIVTDGLSLCDVWMQPKVVCRTSADYLNVTFKQIVVARHMHIRDVTYRISSNDLLNIFYLADQTKNDVIDIAHESFDKWLDVQVKLFIDANSRANAGDLAAICEFIFNHREKFSFNPVPNCQSLELFFRKTNCHDYKVEGGVKIKVLNPSRVKCKTKKTYEYEWETRIITIPEEWKVPVSDTQPLSLFK